MIVREKVAELRDDISVIRKYILPIATSILLGVVAVAYNTYFDNLEKEIVQLREQEKRVQSKYAELKKEDGILSAPKRIIEIAIKKLNMKFPDPSRISFLNGKAKKE
ncbi:MAG: cell division protein FtsL [Aquificae bacterium]|nr:cell division protein FtsL [Aquificota bacterium]